MSNPVESLLEDDHRSLGVLLNELDDKLSTGEIPGALEVLDFIWARLAVHIRAENLQLFPALADAPARTFNAVGPTSEEVHCALARLRTDHDFFMKELTRAIQAMRLMVQNETMLPKEIDFVRQRVNAVKERLAHHNRLEEEQVYVWPALLFDDEMTTRLFERVRHELENLPPRFRDR